MYLIMGASGFLGSYLVKNLQETTNDKIIAVSRKPLQPKFYLKDNVETFECNVTSKEDVEKLYTRVSSFKKIIVFYLIAFFNVDNNINEKYIAWEVNITAFSYFINIFRNVSELYLMSSDMLFKYSRERPYTEFDEVSPLNDYGYHKYLEENMVLSLGFCVIRLPVMMGPSIIKNKLHFYDKIISDLKKGLSINFFSDSWRSMLDFDTVAKILILFSRRHLKKNKIINLSGDQRISKYEYAYRLAKKYKLPTDLIVPISIDQDNTIWKGKRPKCVLLDNSMIKKDLNLDSIKIKI